MHVERQFELAVGSARQGVPSRGVVGKYFHIWADCPSGVVGTKHGGSHVTRQVISGTRAPRRNSGSDVSGSFWTPRSGLA